MSRVRKIAIGAFVLLLAGALLVPRGDHDDPGLTPSGDQKYDDLATSRTAGTGAVTPEMSREIDRVVAEGLTQGSPGRRVAPETLAESLVRCADLEGQRYCLGVGWTHRDPDQVQARIAGAARAVAARGAVVPETTGDLDALALLRRTAAMDPQERAEAERRELTAAARSVAKVWLLRHELEGTPLPDGFLDRHPEARAPEGSVEARTAGTDAVARTKTRADYPRRGVILKGRKVTEQVRSYWCGPASMQMIAWAWQGKRRTQGHWADKLGTTTDGSAISEMVRVVNGSTGFDGPDRAGPYVVLDISGYSYKKWLLLNMRHLVDYRAPLVLHPVLLKKYYPYLDDDASGHFQVGRGYDKRGKKPTQVGYFEPWNQQRFDPSEPYIARVQWRSAYKCYRANQDHFQQNIGV